MAWKEGDWAINGRDIVQIKKIDDEGWMDVSDGSFATYGRLGDRLRPLTLRNKRLAEYFEYYYKELRNIRGEGGFNYPDINRYFNELTLSAIDDEKNVQEYCNKASNFVEEAKNYKPVIDNVHLFR